MVQAGDANSLAERAIFETNDGQLNVDMTAVEQERRTDAGADDEIIGGTELCRERRD
jgi:hypothetical protein